MRPQIRVEGSDESGARTSSKRPRVAGLHRGLVRVLTAAVVVQFYAAWLLITGRPSLHQALGWLSILLALGAVPLAGVAYGWRESTTKWTLAYFVLLVLQPFLALELARMSAYLGAMHPVNALIVFVILLRLAA